MSIASSASLTSGATSSRLNNLSDAVKAFWRPFNWSARFWRGLKNLDRYIKYDSNDIDKTITMVNSGRDSDYYTNTKEADNSKDVLVLVNKYNYVSDDYVYGELVKIPNEYTSPLY